MVLNERILCPRFTIKFYEKHVCMDAYENAPEKLVSAYDWLVRLAIRNSILLWKFFPSILSKRTCNEWLREVSVFHGCTRDARDAYLFEVTTQVLPVTALHERTGEKVFGRTLGDVHLDVDLRITAHLYRDQPIAVGRGEHTGARIAKRFHRTDAEMAAARENLPGHALGQVLQANDLMLADLAKDEIAQFLRFVGHVHDAPIAANAL